MALFELTRDNLVQIPETRFDTKILKSKDLQALLKKDIGVLANDLKVLAEDYGKWEDGGRPIDLLCVDKDANLVVVDVKRTAEGSQIDLQAIRYAALVAAMTFDDAVAAAQRDRVEDPSAAQEMRAELLDFLDWTSPQDGDFGANVRIILVSADFSRELTQSVFWLIEQGLDIRCIRLRPHKLSDGKLLLDVEQIVPLPEAGPFQSTFKKLGQSQRLRHSEQQARRAKFLSELWQTAQKITRLHENQRPVMNHASIAVRVRAGVAFHYTVRKADSRVELFLEPIDRTQQTIEFLASHRGEIEQSAARMVRRRNHLGNRSLRIQEVVEGGFLSPEESWPAIHERLIDAMGRAQKTLRPYLDQAELA